MNKSDSIKFLTIEEIKRLFAVITSKRDRAIFLMAYRHALRASEIGLLMVEDIDLRSLTIRITRLKGSLSSVHPLQLDEVRALKSHLKEKSISLQSSNPFLFNSRNGAPISRRMLDVLMKKYCRESKIADSKAHFHALKHSIATHLLGAGRDIREIQDWLGHKQISNTVIYTAVTPESRSKMAREAFIKLPKF